MEPTVVPAAAPAAPAAGGAGAPPPMEANASAVGTKEPLLGSISYGLPNRGLFDKLVGERALGEPFVTYVGEYNKDVGEDVDIVFSKKVDGTKVGNATFYFKRKELGGLYLKDINTINDEAIRGRGYGKRILSAVMNIARQVGMTTISVESLPSAVSFYLQANPPFTFNIDGDEGNYEKRYNTLLNNGYENKTAKRKAGKVFKRLGPRPMTAKLLRKSRRANRKRGSRIRRRIQ